MSIPDPALRSSGDSQGFGPSLTSQGIVGRPEAGDDPRIARKEALVSDSRTPLQIVRTFLTAMEKGDYDAGLRLVADDCEYTNLPLASVRGPAGIRAVLEPFFAPTIENEFVVLREAATGPIVFVERLDRHHLATGWVELPVTGVLEVHDGRITVWREYFDAATILSKWPTPAS
jgi:limonene-1,2-epoxide hydrolase